MNNCDPCYEKCPNNACKSKIVTYPCDPQSKDFWFQHKLPEDVDPVRSNIYNGCWMCNYEPAQTMNNNLCQRNFHDFGSYQPYNIPYYTDINSILRNIDRPLTKDCAYVKK